MESRSDPREGTSDNRSEETWGTMGSNSRWGHQSNSNRTAHKVAIATGAS